jgi:hypothetical protein
MESAIDKMQCLFQGRPPNLRLPDTNLQKNMLDDYEELENFDAKSYSENWTLGPVPCHRISLLEQYRELSIIMERLLIHLYPSHGCIHSFETIQEHSRAIMVSLQVWRRSLPPHLDLFGSAFPGVCPLPHGITLL